jgi:hypothetical protein
MDATMIMTTTIGTDLARAAVALRRSHPRAPALDVLDVVLRRHRGSLQDFGAATRPGSEFGLVLAAAFDPGMAPEDWRIVDHPNTAPEVSAALLAIWHETVLGAFAARYGLGQ